MVAQAISGFQLSPQQKRLWLLQQDSSVYLTVGLISLAGNLQPSALKKACQLAIDKQEILRTSFRRLPGMKTPVMVVNDQPFSSWIDRDISDCNPQERSAKITALFQEAKHQQFDLEQDSLLNFQLLKLSPTKYNLLVAIPAVCADSRTLANLVRQISEYYAKCLEGQDQHLDDEEIVQYAQFSEWQNQLVDDEDAPTANDYWRQQYSESLKLLKLPFENQERISLLESQSFEIAIDANLATKIESLALNSETSISTLLLTCWQILIWRLTGQSEITIGYTSDRRDCEELEDVLGLLAAVLPLKSHLTSDLHFRELLDLTERTLNASEEWQDYFAPQLLEIENELAFPISFEFQILPEEDLASGVSFALLKQYSCLEPFTVKLNGEQQQDGLRLRFDYNVNCLSQESIQRLARQFQALLANCVEYPEREIGRLEILSTGDNATHRYSERQQLLVEFNNTRVDYPLNKCIHHLIEAQAELNPERTAVVFEDQQLTYRELNVRANQLAHHLQRLGVNSEVAVTLYLERSLEAIIGLLGVLKAGGAYLPIDPASPQERLAFVLQDSRSPVLITQQKLLHNLPENIANVICLDNWQTSASEPTSNPTSEVSIENLVYIIYTSGSTGTPKGVLVEHRQLLNYLYGIQKIINLPTDASFATVSTLSADLGNTAIFPSLCYGGCLHIVSENCITDPDELAAYFRRHPIDCLKIVPSHLKALLAGADAESILPQKRLILGGEAADWDLIAQIQKLAPECEIINHYGPTETTVGTLTYAIDPRQDRLGETVPIGRPINNNQIYILDLYKQPVPIGVPGELYVGGAGVTRGYLNRPDLTEQKFIPNPFENSNNSHLYKTGDLARYFPDGNIEFLGRIDRQVKIHGFRIELPEIEAILSQHPAIRNTAVIVREDRSGNKRLVAYIMPKEKSVPTTTELRDFLRQKLPEYMVPTAFVPLDILPLTSNGKVNYQMLPEPDSSRPTLTQNYVAPQTPSEEILAKIWAQVLGVERVGINDNFFELGGDSILTIQIVAQAKQEGLQFTPKQMFDRPTIAKLAAVADTTPTIEVPQDLVIGEVSLTPIQEWFFAQNFPENHHWNQSVVLEVRQAITPEVLEQAVVQLLQHHDALRLRFVSTENGVRQVNVGTDESVPFVIRDLTTLSGEEQTTAMETAAAEIQSSLNLADGPLLRVVLFDCGASKSSYLFIVIHHLAVDGVSWRVLLSDLQLSYQQLSLGSKIQLPLKTTSFQKWSERLHELANSERLAEERSYWLAEEINSVSSLPVDFPDGTNTVGCSANISTGLTGEETRSLLQDVPAVYGTQIDDILLTALVQGFAKWTGRNSLLVALESHGREPIFDDVDLSRTVGWFTSIFPVLLDLKNSANSGDALKAIKEQLRAIPNGGIGYGLWRYLNQDWEITNALRSQPQAEVKFNYFGRFDQLLEKSALFVPSQLSLGDERSPQGKRSYLLEINGAIAYNKLELNWTYSTEIHRRDTIEKLAQYFVEALRGLITHCQSPEAGGYTPSDFPQAQVSQSELDSLIATINQNNGRN